MNEPYDPSKFTVKLPTGEVVTVKELTTDQAEQTICRLFTVIREMQLRHLLSAEMMTRKLELAGIEIVK